MNIYDVEYEYETIDWYSNNTSKVDNIIIHANSKEDIPALFNKRAKQSWKASLKHSIRILSIKKL